MEAHFITNNKYQNFWCISHSWIWARTEIAVLKMNFLHAQTAFTESRSYAPQFQRQRELETNVIYLTLTQKNVTKIFFSTF